MQRADFEKNVQQKMQELRFRPSNEVWLRVEAGIASKRRRVPVVAWIIFAGLLIGGGSYYLFNQPSYKSQVGVKPTAPGQSIAGKQTDNQKQGKNAIGKSPNTALASSENTTPLSNQQTVAEKKLNQVGQSFTIAKNKSVPLTSKEENVESSGEEKSPSLPYATSDDNLFSLNRGLYRSAPLSMSHDAEPEPRENNKLIDSHSALEMETPSMKKSAAPVKKTKWEFGITASGGVSDLGEELFHGGAVSGLYYTPQSSGTGTNNYGPSEVKQGASLSIGAFVNRTLGMRWKLGAGISYQYFSTSIKIGEKVDSTVFLNQNSFAMDRVNQYYKSIGNTPYLNQYHFLSIPISAQWQFARRLTWENQIIYSRLIHTNALHYDGVNRAYYENSNLFNKDQVSGSTAVLFGFNKNKILVGPQFQYAFTNLLEQGIGDPKHLRALGIKANVTLWKN